MNYFHHSLQECHSQLLRHRNIYLQHVKQVIKEGGPWENPVLQGILKDADLPPNEGRLMHMLSSKYDMHTKSTAFSSGRLCYFDETCCWFDPLQSCHQKIVSLMERCSSDTHSSVEQ